MFHLQGACKYSGSSCAFAHTVEELHQARGLRRKRAPKAGGSKPADSSADTLVKAVDALPRYVHSGWSTESGESANESNEGRSASEGRAHYSGTISTCGSPTDSDTAHQVEPNLGSALSLLEISRSIQALSEALERLACENEAPPRVSADHLLLAGLASNVPLCPPGPPLPLPTLPIDFMMADAWRTASLWPLVSSPLGSLPEPSLEAVFNLPPPPGLGTDIVTPCA
jgi:hypothetical protein